jgi:hypothetical protein
MSPTDPTPTEDRDWVRPVVAVVAMLVLLVAVVLVRGLYRAEPLEPDSPLPDGSRAVVSVLADDLGTDVAVERTTLDAADALRHGATVVVTDPDLLSPAQLDLLQDAQDASGGLVVLVRPGTDALAELAPDVRPGGEVDATDAIAPATCTATGSGTPGPAADLAGGASALTAGRPDGQEGEVPPAALYRPAPGSAAVGCFALDGAYAVAADGTRPTVVLGSPRPLMNTGAADAGNSAFTLNLLAGDTVVWYLPSATDPLADAMPSLADIVPPAVTLGALWAAVVGLVVVAWGAGRRLGPVVPENLPVAVRARETTLGRADLYRRAGARGRAADALRAGTAARLAPPAGVPPHADVDALVAAVAERSDVPPQRLQDLLSTRPVRTDTDLVRLSQDLTALEKELAPHVTD